MRKALIAAIVASALFAVGAFAANFTVQSEDVASGGDAVAACATHVDIDFGTPDWNETLNSGAGDWEVTTATVTFYSSISPLTETAACDGFDARVQVQSAGNADVESDLVEVANGSATVTFAATPVSGIDRASVMVDGRTLYSDPTPTAP